MIEANSNAPELSLLNLQDAKGYLSFCKYGATVFVGFTSRSPLRQLKDARGFVLQDQALQGGTLKYFSKNRIDTKTRDDHGRKVYREVTGTFLLSKLITPRAFLFLTKESGEFPTDGLQRLLYRARKALTRLHLTSGEMKAIASSLLSQRRGRMIVRRSIVRNKRQETTVSYETESIEELYSKAAHENAHVHSFAFRLYSKETGKMTLDAGLSREGKFNFYGGDLKLFLTSVVDHAAELFKKRDDLLQNRSRDEATGVINPIRIGFDEPVFDSVDGIRAFLRTLSKIRHGEFTIFHRNPYLHASFFDFFDGSEFDLFVESANVVIVVPQFHASSSSLLRLCQKIFETFQEGTVQADDSTLRIAAK